MRPRCGSAARSAARARSRPGSGASCSTPHARTCAVATQRFTTSRLFERPTRARRRAARSARSTTGAAAHGRLPPLLRRPRLRGDRRGARDHDRNRRRDPQCSARRAPHPTGGGTNVTDLDRTSLERLLPATPGPADWDDVLSRSGAHQRRRRRLVAVAATALVVAVGTGSAIGSVRDFVLRTGFIGLPPIGATPSSSGERGARDLVLGPLGCRTGRKVEPALGCTPTGD